MRNRGVGAILPAVSGKKIRHVVTGEALPDPPGQPRRLWPHQTLYLRSLVTRPAQGVDGVLRDIVDEHMRRTLGNRYETEVRRLAEEAAREKKPQRTAKKPKGRK